MSDEKPRVEELLVLLDCGHWVSTHIIAAKFGFLEQMKWRRPPTCFKCTPANHNALIIFVASRSIDRLWVEERP